MFGILFKSLAKLCLRLEPRRPKISNLTHWCLSKIANLIVITIDDKRADLIVSLAPNYHNDPVTKWAVEVLTNFDSDSTMQTLSEALMISKNVLLEIKLKMFAENELWVVRVIHGLGSGKKRLFFELGYSSTWLTELIVETSLEQMLLNSEGWKCNDIGLLKNNVDHPWLNLPNKLAPLGTISAQVKHVFGQIEP